MGFTNLLRRILDTFLILQILPGSFIGGTLTIVGKVLDITTDIIKKEAKDEGFIDENDNFTTKVAEITRTGILTNVELAEIQTAANELTTQTKDSIVIVEVNGGGGGLPGAIVSYQGRIQETDENGITTFTGLNAGVFELVIVKEGWITQRQDYEAISNLTRRQPIFMIRGEDPEPTEPTTPPVEGDPDFIGPIQTTEPIEEELSFFDRIKDFFAFETAEEREERVTAVLERARLLRLEHPILTSEEAQKAVLIVGGIAIVGALGALIATGVGVTSASIAALSSSRLFTASSALKLAKGAAVTGAGIDVLATWLASDNVISGISFTLKKIRDLREAEMLTDAETRNKIEETRKWLEGAAKFVETSVTVNPTLILFKTPFLINIEKGFADFELEVKLIDKVIRDQKAEGEAIILSNETKIQIEEKKLIIQELVLSLEIKKDEKRITVENFRISRKEADLVIVEREGKLDPTEAERETRLREDITFLELKKLMNEGIDLIQIKIAEEKILLKELKAG